MRGDTCSIFKNFRFSPLNSKNRVSTHFCTTSIFKNFLPPGTPIVPLYPPMTPQNPKFQKFWLRPNHVRNRFPAFFCDIRKFFGKFCLVPEGTFSRFFAIFLDFRQKGQKPKNIEFRAPTSTAIALKVFFHPRGDKSESEKKYAGVAKHYPAAYSRFYNLANLD